MSEIKLTIDEVIEHCERVVNNYSRMDIGKEIVERGTESCFVKQYLEHKQVAEWLKELKNLRGAMERIIERIENARQKYQRLVKEQGEKEDEAINILFRGMMNIVKEEGGIE